MYGVRFWVGQLTLYLSESLSVVIRVVSYRHSIESGYIRSLRRYNAKGESELRRAR